MTLGGLALAVGILVDDATVEIENINRNIAEGKDSKSDSGWCAADRGAGIRFDIGDLHRILPMFFLTGVARYLSFRWRSGGVRHAGSYLLSRTLVPTMASICCAGHEQEAAT